MPLHPHTVPARSRLRPAAGAAAMATGIISVGLLRTGYLVLSAVFLVLASTLWALLAAAFVSRLVRDPRRWMREARTPPALTAVAATTVLGTRYSLLGWQKLAEALLLTAVLAWPVLLTSVVRHWQRRMPGVVFLSCVATQGIAVLGATLCEQQAPHGRWLGYASMPVFWLGLVLYALALPRFDVRQIATGAGDHWVAAGALAISTLAAAKLLLANQANDLWNTGTTDVLTFMCGLLFALDACGYAVLSAAEWARPRLRYDVRRWSTVFPMGMTAVAALFAATALDASWLLVPGQVLLWIATAAWLVTAAGALRSLWNPPDHPPA